MSCATSQSRKVVVETVKAHILVLRNHSSEFRKRKYTTFRAMCDRHNTIVCSFDLRSPQINAFQIHEGLYETVHLKEDDICVIQIVGPLHKVYVKFVNNESMMRVIQPIQGDLEFHHENGEIS
jgi:hypothetical protein